MRRAIVRFVMFLIGGLSLAIYVAAGVGLYWLFRTAWVDRPSAATIVIGLAAITFILGYLTYRGGTSRLLAQTNAREIGPEDTPELFERFDRLCRRMEIERPRLLVAELGEPNAFAIGDVREGAIVFSDSLVRLLTLDELTAVLAHELGHLEARDTLVQVLAFTGLQTVVLLIAVALLPVMLVLTGVAKAIAWASGSPAGWTRTFAGRLRFLIVGLVMIAPTVVTLVLLAHSRHREFAADDRAAELTGNPSALARALQKIHDSVRAELQLRGMITDAGNNQPMMRLLATHPALERRVARLERMAERQQRERAESHE